MLHLSVANSSGQCTSMKRSAIPDCQPNLTLEDFNGSVYSDSDIVSQAVTEAKLALLPENLPGVHSDALKTSIMALKMVFVDVCNKIADACNRQFHGLRSFHLFVSFMHVLSCTTFALVPVC
jgi:hypothetical protein